MACPFQPEYGEKYCYLQVNMIQIDRKDNWVLHGWKLCIGEDKCPILR
jgi:hypothetical protein